MTEHVLDNVVWHSLLGHHEHLAEGDGAARRYHPDVSVFHAMPDDAAASWSALGDLLAGHGTAIVFRGLDVSVPDGWTTLAAGQGHQMVLTRPAEVPALPDVDASTGARVSLRPLGTDDVDEMTALVALTEPGPFRPRTIELGGYVGVFHDDVLVAMAGQRMRPPGHCEVSAVCTHPDARRRGYASVVTLAVAAAVQARGETAFLHVAHGNDSARLVYESIGFEHRRSVHFVAARPGR